MLMRTMMTALAAIALPTGGHERSDVELTRYVYLERHLGNGDMREVASVRRFRTRRYGRPGGAVEKRHAAARLRRVQRHSIHAFLSGQLAGPGRSYRSKTGAAWDSCRV